MLFLSWKKTKEEWQIKKETQTRNQKKAKSKDKKEKRKKRRKERDRERETEKEGGQKRLREKERETLKINKKCPFLGGEQGFFCIQKTPKKRKTKKPKTNKEGLGPTEVARQKNKTKKQKKTKKKTQKKTKTNKEGLGPSEVALRATSPDPKKNTKTNNTTKTEKKKPKKQQKYQKIAFQLSVKVFLFLGGFWKFPFFTPWPKKPEPKTHYKNRCFRPFFFEKLLCVTKRPFLDQKTQNL